VPAGYWRELEATNPFSFDLVMRDIIPSEGDEPDLPSPVGRQRLRVMIERGIYRYHREPAYYIYRVSDGIHSQTGVVAEVEADAYDRELIKRHEHTQPRTEAALVAAMQRLHANSYPMCLTYRHAGVNALVDRFATAEPMLDFLGRDGVQQTVWKIDSPEDLAEFDACLSHIEALYITDGHHRAAAGAAVARNMAALRPDSTGLEPFHYMMAVIYPSQQLRVVGYDRLVSDLAGLTEVEFVEKVRQQMDVERIHSEDPEDARPRQPGTFGMLVGTKWYRLTVPDTLLQVDDPYTSLDVVILNNLVLGPILGINDPRTSERLEYIPGTVPPQETASRARAGAFFLVHPTTIDQVAAVADRGLVMPPKSTWFLPKISSGLFLRMLE
jgi:uncharacterized protein (DUF1015 family)